MKFLPLSLALALSSFALSPSPVLAAELSPVHKPDPSSTVFQYSTLPALGLGLYDGELTFKQLLRHGNFGLGTLKGLDGEIIIHGGKAYQVRSDGQVFNVPGSAITPFAVVSKFKANKVISVRTPTNFAQLQKLVDFSLPSPNLPYAIEVSGNFSEVKTRSVPAQKPPYPPLADVVKTQSLFQIPATRGTLVGFRFPSYLGEVNLAGYHFHFLTENKKQGGHVLDCTLTQGEIKIQYLRNLQLQLPDNKAFDAADLSADQKAALEKAEKMPDSH